MKFLLIVAALFLSACSSTQGLSVHTFTNADAQAVLKKELPKLSKELSVMGLPVQFNVDDLNVNIGPDNRDVIALALESSAEIGAFSFSYPVRLSLQVEGSPYYDSSKKAVFIRNISLLDSSIDAGGFRGNLSFLNKEAMQLINDFLEVNPVYELDLNNPKIALLSKLPLDLKVEQGALKIVPRI
jgi:hypothetical protein